MLLRSAVFLVALALAQAIEAAPQPLTPTGKWNVDFGDSQCLAHRDYGTPEKPLRLVLKAPALGDVMQVAVLQEDSASPPRQVTASVTVDGRRPVSTELLMHTPKGAKERVYLLNMSSSDFASVRQARTLSVRSQGLNQSFALSDMEPLMKIVDQCVVDLRRVFNVGAAGPDPSRFKSRARGNIAQYFSDADYPEVAVMKGQSGRVGYAILVGEDGRVADCTIVATSGVPALDSQACAVLKRRVKLQPAIGVDGKPAKDALVGGIVWRTSTPRPRRR